MEPSGVMVADPALVEAVWLAKRNMHIDICIDMCVDIHGHLYGRAYGYAHGY